MWLQQGHVASQLPKVILGLSVDWPAKLNLCVLPCLAARWEDHRPCLYTTMHHSSNCGGSVNPAADSRDHPVKEGFQTPASLEQQAQESICMLWTMIKAGLWQSGFPAILRYPRKQESGSTVLAAIIASLERIWLHNSSHLASRRLSLLHDPSTWAGRQLLHPGQTY